MDFLKPVPQVSAIEVDHTADTNYISAPTQNYLQLENHGLYLCIE